jgi:hypothetical protein
MLSYDVVRKAEYLEYFRHDVLHRKDNPACLWDDGYVMWYEYGLRHRIDGPAIIYPNNSMYGANIHAVRGVQKY